MRLVEFRLFQQRHDLALLCDDGKTPVLKDTFASRDNELSHDTDGGP